MDNSELAFAAGTTPPEPPTKTQQDVVNRGRLAWHIQTPLSALAAYLIMTRTRMGANAARQWTGGNNRALLLRTMAVSLPIVGWDLWYFAKVERVVKERQAWERAQSTWRRNNVGAGSTGSSGAGVRDSSEGDMGDPWA